MLNNYNILTRADTGGEMLGDWQLHNYLCLKIACHHAELLKHPDPFTVCLVEREVW